ncbi:MAG: serine hydrolase domain-containing protein, partial [Waterburya sp.]
MNKLVTKLSLKVMAITLAVMAGSSVIIGVVAIKIYQKIIYPDSFIKDVDWYKPLATIKGKASALPVATSSSIPQESLNKIATYAQEKNSYALLVIHKGKIVSERYWEGFTSTSTSNSMSMSKTIVALLIGIAIEEGHIESELDPVAKYIPEWSQDQRSKITLQDLLSMQSGLKDENNFDSIAYKTPAIKPPKKVFEYNNINSQILAEVLVRATGEKYIDYLSTRLWQPLQANDAAILLDRDRPQDNPKTFCCLFATPHDWGKVGQLFIDRGKVNNQQVVPSAWLDKMVQPS